MRTYSTQSLYEASFLLAKGFKLVSRDSAGRKTTLHFDNSPELQKAVVDFYNGGASVRAKAFVDTYRSLKDMIFQK